MADVAADLKTWSATASSNSPSGSTAVGTGLDDNLREIQKVIRQDLANAPTDTASASTTDLGAVASNYVRITGTTTITSFGTVSSGIWKFIRFAGALTLTHNASSLILPGGANITTVAGDCALAVSEGSGNWRVVFYVPTTSFFATLAGTETLTNKTLTSPTVTSPVINTQVTGTAIADQSAMETASSTSLIVSPGRQHFHPSAAKAWCHAGVAGDINASYGVSSVTDTATGTATFNWSVNFSSASYAVVGTVQATSVVFHRISSQTAAAADQTVSNSVATLDVDPTFHYVVAFGDQ